MTLALVKKGMIGKAVIDEQAKAREPFEPKIKKEPKSSSPEKGKAKGTGKKGRSGKGAKSRKSGNLTVKEGKLVISKIQAAVEESSGEDEPTEFKTETELILVDESLDTYSNTDGATYLCSICDKLFASTETLEAHMEIHSMKTHLLTCSICSKEFLTPEGLEKHIKMHNRRKGKTANSSSSSAGVEISTNTLEFEVDGQKHYKCKLCGKVFSTKSKARDHERTHTGEKPYECDICGTSFRQKSNLSSHKRVTHLQEKRYQCDICEKAFKWRRLLKGHIMSVHTGERPYRCEFCDAGFVYQQHYKKHMRIHTGEKPFKCELCGKSFNSSNNCRAHMFTHSDKKPYECRICGAGFMRKPLVLGHIKQHPHVDDPDGYVKANSPSTAVASITMKEDTTEHGVSPKKETINQRNTVPHTTHTVEDGIHQFIISEPITTREPGNNGEGMNYVFGTFQSQGATHYTSLNLNQW